MSTLARVESYLADYGALIPTAALADLAKLMATELRKRGEWDAANYCDRAAGALEG